MPKIVPNARLDLINAIKLEDKNLITILLREGRSSTGVWGGLSKKSVLPFADFNGQTPLHLMAEKGMLNHMMPYIKSLLISDPKFVKREFAENRDEDLLYQTQIRNESQLGNRQLTMLDAQATTFLKICLEKANSKGQKVWELCGEQDKNYLKNTFPDLIPATAIKAETMTIATAHNDENQHPNHKASKVPVIVQVNETDTYAEAFNTVQNFYISKYKNAIEKSLGTEYTMLELFIWCDFKDDNFASRIPTDLFSGKDNFIEQFLATQKTQDFTHVNSKLSVNAFGLACLYKNPIIATQLLAATNFAQNQKDSIKEAIKWNSPEVIDAIINYYGEQTDWHQILFSSIKNARHNIIDIVLTAHQFEAGTITSIKGPKGQVEYTPENYLLHNIRKEAQKNSKLQMSSADQENKVKYQKRFEEKIDKFMASIETMRTKADSTFNIDNPKTKNLLYKISVMIEDIQTNDKYLTLKNIIGAYEFNDETDNVSTSTGVMTYGTGTASMLLGGDADSGGEDGF